MKTIDEKKCKKQQKRNKKRKKGARGTEAIVKGLELNDLVCAFKLGFLQLIFKSNLELALSIILKQRGLYESKHVVVDCRCLKI